MSGKTTEGANGFNYDFGVSIARGTVAALTATVAAVYSLTESISGLVSADEELITMINKNQIAFGGYANTMKALAFAEQKAAEGIGFNTGDMVEGFKLLQRSGMNAKKETELVAKAATGMGASFADTARIIQTGDFSALAEAGIISQRTAMSYDAMGYSARAATKHVHALIEQANKKGMFNGAVQSISSIMTRFKQFKTDFVMAIIGDPRDPEGLAFNVKKYMTKIADFINKHRNTIIYYGKMIGRVFRFVIDIVGDFIKTMWKQFFGVSAFVQKSNKLMQDSLLSLGLWLEILRIKIKMFFEDYGKYIVYAVKAFMLFKGLKFVFSLFSSLNRALQFSYGFLSQIIPSLKLMGRYLRYVANVRWGGFLGALTTIRTGFIAASTAAWSFTAALLANPITWIVVAVIALVAAVVWLVKNWDDLWYKTQSMSDTWYNMLNPLYMIIKYWEEIKAVVGNLWIGVKSQFSAMWDSVVIGINNIKYSFMKIKNWIRDYLYTPFKEVWDSIGNFFQKNIMEPITNFFKKIGDFLDKYISGPIAKFFGTDNSATNQKAANMAVNGSKMVAASMGTVADRMAKEKFISNVISHGGKATKEDIATYASDIKSNTERARALKSSGDVKAIKENKYAGMTAEKIAAGETPPSTSIKYSANSNVPDMTDGEFGAGSKKVYVQSGAVQINLGTNSGMNEEKIANLVLAKLKRLSTQENVRQGK